MSDRKNFIGNNRAEKIGVYAKERDHADDKSIDCR